jgi:hypothetical protein
VQKRQTLISFTEVRYELLLALEEEVEKKRYEIEKKREDVFI